jgi:UDP-4-amino-4,6-dideoxy-N-acetyl-beta-L-altrosamine transaminase
VRPIPYGRQVVDEDDIAAVVAVLRGDWLTQGPAVEAFEAALCAAADAPYAVAFSSGTAALHAACLAADLGPGDEVVTSAMTFAASANCAAYVGATPVFADIDPATGNVSRETVAAVLGERVRALVPVDYAGLAAPVEALRALVGDDVTIIEDAAHALGARRPDGGVVGDARAADMVMFSFHPVKAVTTGEGGAITTRSAALAGRLRELRSHGMVRTPERLRAAGPDDGAWYHEQHELGHNWRLTDVASALGASQVAKLERFIAARNAVASRYRAALGELESLVLPPAAPDGGRHAYHLFVVRHRGCAAARRALFDGLRARGVLAQVHYLPVHLHPYYRERFGTGPGLCPAAEAWYDGCLSLPCHPGLGEEDQERVIEAVRALA